MNVPEPPPLVAEPLTAAAFAPFGQVPGGSEGDARRVNLGTAWRHDHAAALENGRPGARPNLAVFRCDPCTLPFRATLLERHPHSTQLFASLRGGRWLVIVAPTRADGGPDEAGMRAFACEPGQALNLARGCWHHPVIALAEPAELLMLAWEDGGPGDLEERALAAPRDVVPAT